MGGGRGERLLGTQVDGQNDPVCLIREREKRKALCSPLIHALASCHGNTAVLSIQMAHRGGSCLSACLSLLLIIRDTQVTDILHRKAMTHAHHFSFQSGKKKKKNTRVHHTHVQDETLV